MSDRLHVLRRQKALLSEHLAWLDREIAAEERSQPPTLPSPLPIQGSMAHAPGESTDAVDADALIARYREQESLDPRAARRGCLLAGLAIMALLAAAVVGTYFVFYRNAGG
jgi:hypothetical protein